MLKVSIIGATGYAGAELLSILQRHPEVEIIHITSESHTGKKISELYPHLNGIFEKELESLNDIEKIGAESDFVFIALPHGHAMDVGRKLENLPVRIIDLGADYRFSDTSIYEKWYNVPHTHKNAPRVYGLAEIYREEIMPAVSRRLRFLHLLRLRNIGSSTLRRLLLTQSREFRARAEV